MDNNEERRRIPRIEVSWSISIFMDEETIEGESRNISSEGLYICIDKPLPLNETFRISITPPHHQAIGVTGKIIRSDLYGIDGDKGVCCIGVCLVEISEDDRRSLNDLISVYL
ncbi:PilZ domain-containing protein [Thermodesulfobacteriota bacterium]